MNLEQWPLYMYIGALRLAIQPDKINRSSREAGIQSSVVSHDKFRNYFSPTYITQLFNCIAIDIMCPFLFFFQLCMFVFSVKFEERINYRAFKKSFMLLGLILSSVYERNKIAVQLKNKHESGSSTFQQSLFSYHV